jgi:hypothetical protein
MLTQPLLLALNAKNAEIAAELASFASPPYSQSEYQMVLAIAAGALNGTTLTPEQLAYLPTEAQAVTFRDAYLGARARYNRRSAERDAVVAGALATLEHLTLDEEAVVAAIEAV